MLYKAVKLSQATKRTIRKQDHFPSDLLSTIRKPQMSYFWIPTVI